MTSHRHSQHAHRSATTTWPIVGAITAALAASACCWLPLLAMVVGFSTVGIAQVFEQYRPYLLTATFALLGLAFYLTYRPIRRPAPVNGGTTQAERTMEDDVCSPAGEDNDTCCVPEQPHTGIQHWTARIHRWNRVLIWPITVIVLLIAFFPNYVNTLLGTTPASPVPAKHGGTDVVLQETFTVHGMTCEGCASGIRAMLEARPEIARVELRYPNPVGRIDWVQPPTPEVRAEIQQRLQRMGYTLEWGSATSASDAQRQ